MAKKARKRLHQMPPLSFLDKVIYWSVMLILIVLWFGLIFAPIMLRDKIAFRDEIVVAASGDASLLWGLIPFITSFLMSLILWLIPYQSRTPIFGLRNFKYGPPAWPKKYPLFMKNKPHVFVSERTKKERKKIATLLLVVLLVSFIPFPLSLYGRNCLYSDGSIVQYNSFNGKSREFTSGQIESLKIETYRYSTGRHYMTKHWGVRLVFTTDNGRKYTFTQSDFRSDVPMDTRYWLNTMLRLTRRYDPSIISFGGIENLENVIKDKMLTDAETEMLYQLFRQ